MFQRTEPGKGNEYSFIFTIGNLANGVKFEVIMQNPTKDVKPEQDKKPEQEKKVAQGNESQKKQPEQDKKQQ